MIASAWAYGAGGSAPAPANRSGRSTRREGNGERARAAMRRIAATHHPGRARCIRANLGGRVGRIHASGGDAETGRAPRIARKRSTPAVLGGLLGAGELTSCMRDVNDAHPLGACCTRPATPPASPTSACSHRPRSRRSRPRPRRRALTSTTPASTGSRRTAMHGRSPRTRRTAIAATCRRRITGPSWRSTSWQSAGLRALPRGGGHRGGFAISRGG